MLLYDIHVPLQLEYAWRCGFQRSSDEPTICGAPMIRQVLAANTVQAWTLKRGVLHQHLSGP